MTELEFVTILNKKSYNIDDLTLLIDQYCKDTNRIEEDFTKIMEFILHIPGLAQAAIENITRYYKKKWFVVSVGEIRGEIYFYKTLN